MNHTPLVGSLDKGPKLKGTHFMLGLQISVPVGRFVQNPVNHRVQSANLPSRYFYALNEKKIF